MMQSNAGEASMICDFLLPLFAQMASTDTSPIDLESLAVYLASFSDKFPVKEEADVAVRVFISTL